MRTPALLVLALPLLASLSSCVTARGEGSVLGADLGRDRDARIERALLRDGTEVRFGPVGAMIAGDSGAVRVIGITAEGAPREVPIDSVVEARLVGGFDPREPVPGPRVVAVRRDGTAVGGMLEGVVGDTLVLGSASSTERIARGDLDHVALLGYGRAPISPGMALLGGYVGALLVIPLSDDYYGGFDERTYIDSHVEGAIMLGGVGAVGFGWLGYEIDRSRSQARHVLRTDDDGWSELATIRGGPGAPPPPLSLSLHVASVAQRGNQELGAQLDAARLYEEYRSAVVPSALLWLRRIDVAYTLLDELEAGIGWTDISEVRTGRSVRVNQPGGVSYTHYLMQQITGGAWLALARIHPLPRTSGVDLAITGGAGIASTTLRRRITSWRTPQDVVGDGERDEAWTVNAPAALVGGRVGYAVSPSMRIGVHVDHIFTGSIDAPADSLTGIRPATIPLGNTGVGFYLEQRF